MANFMHLGFRVCVLLGLKVLVGGTSFPCLLGATVTVAASIELWGSVFQDSFLCPSAPRQAKP